MGDNSLFVTRLDLRCGAQHVKVSDSGKKAYRLFGPMASKIGSPPRFKASIHKLLQLSLPKAWVSRFRFDPVHPCWVRA
jgi:hypothetical protein